MSRYYVVDSLCCPSRSASSPASTRTTTASFTNARPRRRGTSPLTSTATSGSRSPSRLHDAGYRTAMMGKYLNQYQPAYPEPPGGDEWDVAGKRLRRVSATTSNQNGRQQHYGKDPKDYLTDVLARQGHLVHRTHRPPRAGRSCSTWPRSPRTRRTRPRPATRNAAQQLTYPKTPAYDRLPASPPSWLAGHPHLSAADQATITTTFRKAGGRRSLRRRHDRASSRTNSGPRAWTGTRTSCFSSGQRLPTWASTR